MGIVWLGPDDPFPSPAAAPAHGLLAAGADLSIDRLTAAYRSGIFPWFSEDDPLLWWSPDPRMVLACDAWHESRSLAKLLRQIERQQHSEHPPWLVTVDTAFDRIIAACAEPRTPDGGTWISSAIQDAYGRWHRAGGAHSVECWHHGQLAGGLYGVSMGGFFFGESMFSRTSNASKIALAHLVAFLRRAGVAYIDCQQQTRHMASLGAQPMPRAQFMQRLREHIDRPAPAWRPARLLVDGRLVDQTATPAATLASPDGQAP